MGYKLLGYVTWQGVKWYVRRRAAQTRRRAAQGRRRAAIAGAGVLLLGGAAYAARSRAAS